MIVILGMMLTLVMLGVIVWMLLTGRLREKYAVLWLAIGTSVLVVGLFPQLLELLTIGLGVQLPSNLLFALAIFLLLGVSLHHSWELSRAEGKIRRLAEESALARAELDGLKARIASCAPTDDDQDPTPT